MSTRTHDLPLQWLSAQVSAIPLASEYAFTIGVSELDPRVEGPTLRLWRKAETDLITRSPGLSVDEMVIHRDDIWFGRAHQDEQWFEQKAGDVERLMRSQLDELRFREAPTQLTRPVPMMEFARRLASACLNVRGGWSYPAPLQGSTGFSEPGRSIESMGRLSWRWLSLTMPPELLVAIHPKRPERVSMVSGPVRNWLNDLGYAEVHVHYGASIDGSLLWSAFTRELADPNRKATALHSPGADFDEGRKLEPWLIRAAIARLIVAGFLFHGHDVSFERYVATVVERVRVRFGVTHACRLQTVLQEVALGRVLGGSTSLFDPDNVMACRALYRHLIGGFFGFESALDRMRDKEDRASRALELIVLGDARDRLGGFDNYEQWLRDLLRRTDGLDAGPDGEDHYWASLFAGDPIAPIVGPRPYGVTPQIALDRKASAFFEHLQQPWMRRARPENDFFTLYIQTTRLRCCFHRYVVERPLTPGLAWFVRFYDRLRATKRALSRRVALGAAFRSGGVGRGLRSLELRAGPSQDKSELWREVRELRTVFERYPGRRHDLEVGLVFHLIRDRGGRFKQGAPPAHGIGSMLLGRPRYSRQSEELDRRAVAIEWLLENHPLTVEWIRGFDVCADEYGVPTWVVARLLRRLRRAGSKAAARASTILGRSIAPPRLTAHAGEDFVHLLGGLRRVDESLRYFEMGEGDRLGHALALGVDCERWARRTNQVGIAKLERLNDLVWEWSRRARRPSIRASDRDTLLAREIPRLAEEIFGDPAPSAHQLERLSLQLNSDRHLRKLGYPRLIPEPPPHLGLMFEYLSNTDVLYRGRETEWVDVAEEATALAEIQADLCDAIRERNLVIEINPSSNLLVGNFSELKHHPLFSLRPPSGSDGGLPVAIGSDDPVIFETDLAVEYQLVNDALRLAGFGDRDVRRWMDDARRVGLTHRFTLPTVTLRRAGGLDPLHLRSSAAYTPWPE